MSKKMYRKIMLATAVLSLVGQAPVAAWTIKRTAGFSAYASALLVATKIGVDARKVLAASPVRNARLKPKKMLPTRQEIKSASRAYAQAAVNKWTELAQVFVAPKTKDGLALSRWARAKAFGKENYLIDAALLALVLPSLIHLGVNGVQKLRAQKTAPQPGSSSTTGKAAGALDLTPSTPEPAAGAPVGGSTGMPHQPLAAAGSSASTASVPVLLVPATPGTPSALSEGGVPVVNLSASNSSAHTGTDPLDVEAVNPVLSAPLLSSQPRPAAPSTAPTAPTAPEDDADGLVMIPLNDGPPSTHHLDQNAAPVAAPAPAPSSTSLVTAPLPAPAAHSGASLPHQPPAPAGASTAPGGLDADDVEWGDFQGVPAPVCEQSSFDAPAPAAAPAHVTVLSRSSLIIGSSFGGVPQGFVPSLLQTAVAQALAPVYPPATAPAPAVVSAAPSRHALMNPLSAPAPAPTTISTGGALAVHATRGPSVADVLGDGDHDLEDPSRPVSPVAAAEQADVTLMRMSAERSILDRLLGEAAAVGDSLGTMSFDGTALQQAAFGPQISSFVAPTLLADVVASRHSDFEPREPQALVLPGVDAVGHRPSIVVLAHQPASLHDTSSSRAARVEAIRSASPNIENVLGAGQHDLVTPVPSRSGSPVAASAAAVATAAPAPAPMVDSANVAEVLSRRQLKRKEPGVYKIGDQLYWVFLNEKAPYQSQKIVRPVN